MAVIALVSTERRFPFAHAPELNDLRLCGWKTRAMFDRYNITNQEDLNAAVAQRFNGTHAANNQVEEAQAR